MAQEPYKDDNKPRLPKLNNRPNSDGEPPRKGPRFSIYWVYAIIFAVLIGFQVFGHFIAADYRNRFQFSISCYSNQVRLQDQVDLTFLRQFEDFFRRIRGATESITTVN